MQISRKFNFKNDQGLELSGRLELPSTKPIAFALFAHCFTCSKNFVAAAQISKNLSLHGIATLRFDFTGLGNSEGDFGNSNFSSNVADLKAAFNAIKKEFGAPSILIGHSLGGAAVLKLQSELEEIKAVVTIGAPSDVHHVSYLFSDQIDKIKECGSAKVNLAGREFEIQEQFINDINEQDLLASLGNSKKAFLVLHSPIDDTVSVDHAANIYKSLKHPKSFISLDQMDHLITNKEDAKYISGIISSWVARYIEKTEEEGIKIDKGIIVKSRAGHKFTNDIYSSKHSLVADEPKSVKGDDLGMPPYDLLLSSLGACTSMTMRMYADRKGFDLQDVEVRLTHEKVKVSETEFQDKIYKEIKLTGNLSEEESQRIYEISHKCPVNRTLLSEIDITSSKI